MNNTVRRLHKTTTKNASFTAFKLFLALFFISRLLCSCAYAQQPVDLVPKIDEQLIPVTALIPGNDYHDLDRLKSILNDKSIIGIGEATHGTKEFFQFKHRMLEFLVKELGVKTFVIEADFAGTQVMNDYILNGQVDVKNGLFAMGFGIWMTQEFVDMMNWLKAYNVTQPPENKVRMFGCDMQWAGTAMLPLRDYLSERNRLSPKMNAGFEAMKKYMPSLTAKERKALRASVNALAGISFSDLDSGKRAMYKHYVRQLEQVVDYMDARSTMFPARQSDVRDKYMAENCEWIYNYTSGSKLMI